MRNGCDAPSIPGLLPPRDSLPLPAGSIALSTDGTPRRGFGIYEFGIEVARVDAERYRGKRVRFTGWLRTESVDHDDGWAGLWLRIDGAAGRSLAFDNTEEEPVRETADWTRVAVVLDVDERAEALAFGFMLVGSGKVWADDLAFEEVGRDVPVTGDQPRPLPKEPVNLGFDGLG